MSSNPFDDLPALTRAAAPTKRARVEEEQEPSPPAKAAEDEAEEQQQPAPDSSAKRARVDEDDDEAKPTADPVAAALARLTPHLRTAARIPKAGPLLRQLLDGGAAAAAGPSPRHRPALFGAVAAAFSDPSQFLACPPASRVEYARIARSAQRVDWKAGGGGDDDGGEAAEAYCGEAAAAWALLRGELLGAEDAFALSKGLGKLKALVDALPEWEEGDEVEEEGEEEEAGRKRQQNAAAAAASLPPLPPPPPIAWPPDRARVLLLRRRAALDCALCARDRCHARAPWAAAPVELALEHVGAPARAARFCPGAQRARAAALLDFVSSARAARRAGAAAAAAAGGGAKDDRGAFERARAQFAAVGDVSARGSVGGGGGGGSAPWLG